MLDTLFLVAAVVGGTIMVCQFVLTLVGLGEHAVDLGDGDFSGDGHSTGHDLHHHDASWLFEVVTFRTLVAAAAFFGITGKAALSAGYPHGVSVVLACVVGLAAMYGIYWMMKALTKLTSSGNENIQDAVGRRATIYVPIAEKGIGKVQVTLQDRTVEYQAISDEHRAFKTGETVEVVQVKNSDTVAVRGV